MGKKDKVKAETEDVEEMREIDPEDDAVSYSDSGHASDAASHKSYAVSTRDDDSETSSIADDPTLMVRTAARERLQKCLICMKEFWKIILLLLQAGVLGALGILAYYIEFLDILPKKHTVFDCDDESISQTLNNTVFEHFIFGRNIDEQWLYLFSWMAPPGIIILTELFYSMHTGCSLSHHLKTPLILRRTFRIVGNYFFGVVASLMIAKSMKLFLTTPRPYFLHVCQPNVTYCREATEEICTVNNHTELDDARTSFPSMPVSALSYGCIFIGVYLHQMIKNAKAAVLQPLASTTFLVVALLGACIEIGVKRSHWYDVVAGFILGFLQALYQIVTLNFFVEKFQPPLPPKKEDNWIQTDPLPESDDEYPYEEIKMGKLPKRKKRYIDDSTCFHRATSFDSSFQSDMARSVKMFKDMNNVWMTNKPPSFSQSQGFYDQNLPKIEEEKNEVKTPPPTATPAELHVEAEVNRHRSTRETVQAVSSQEEKGEQEADLKPPNDSSLKIDDTVLVVDLELEKGIAQ